MKILSSWLLVLGLLLFSLTTKANHILGGNISWDCLGGGQYEITLTIYKDCFGATPSTPDETLFFFPNGCSLPFSADAPFVSEQEISDLCPQELASSSCNGGLMPGTQMLVYSIVVTLDTSCPWTVIWSAGDWNYFVNLDTSALPNSYFETTIDPTAGCNDSGSVTSSGAPYYCSGDIVSFDFNFTPPPGFTFNISLTSVLTDLGANALYQGGYSAAVPIPGYNLDPVTGEMTFTAPFIPGNYVVGIEINIYDGGGNLVGTMLESMSFVVRFCFPTPTEFTEPEVTSADPGVNIITDNEISICAGGLLCYEVEATNTNVSKSVTLSSDFTTVFPSGTFNTSGLNPATGESCVQTDENMIGDYTITYDAIDNSCIFPDSDQIQIIIHILPNLSTSTTGGLICYGDSFNIVATGDTQFQWNVLSGDVDPTFSCANCGNQNITPDSTVVIEVIASNGIVGCNISDTITVNVSLSPINGIITNETCNGNDGSINVSVFGGTGNYSYSWDIPSFVEDPTGLGGGTYNVTITDLGLPGCSLDTSFFVDTSPPPSGFISGDTTICMGESANILFNMTGTGPFAVTMNPTGPPSVVDGDTFSVTPGATTVYTLDSFIDSNIPSCTYTNNSTVTVTVLPLVNALFSGPATICNGDQANIVVNISEPGTFNITYTIDGVVQPVISATDGDVLNFSPTADVVYNITEVAYPVAPTCPNPQNNPLNVIVNALPGLTFSGAATICSGDNTDLTIDLTGTGPWQVDMTANGIPEVLPVIVANQFVYNVTPLITTEYCITEITDLGVNCASTFNSCLEVVVNPVPSVTFGVDDVICPGDNANLTVDLTSTPGAFNVVIQSDDGTNINTTSINNVIDPFVFVDAPLVNTIYTLLSVEYSANPGECVINPGLVATIDVADSPTAQITDTLCAQNSFTYQIEILINGGDIATYNITPSTTGAGVLVGNVYTSGIINSGNGESWTITDGNNCNPVVVTVDPYSCPIVTYSGTMLSDTVAICGIDVAIATWNNDGVSDGFDDQFMFILHDSPTQTIGQIYAIDCNDTGFNDGDTPLVFGTGPGEIQYGVVYYVSAVAGDDDGSGDCVDLGAPFISVSEGQPIVFFEDPTAIMSGGGIACEGNTIDVEIDFSTGQSPWTISYTIDGIAQPDLTTSDNPYIIAANTSGAYVLVAVNSLGCFGIANGNADVTINPLPTAIITADGNICEGDTYDLNIALTGSANWDVDLGYDDGTSLQVFDVDNISTANSLYTVSDAGTYSIISVTDDNGCTNAGDLATATLVVNPLPTALFAFADTSYCAGSSIDLQINLTGTPDWTLTYTIDAGIPQQWTSTSDLFTQNISVPGIYTITGIDDNNCPNLINESITITEITAPIADAGPDQAICSGDDVVLGTAAIVGQTYTWDNANILDDITLAQPTASALNPGPGDIQFTISVVALNAECPASDDMTLVVHPLPIADAGVNDTICYAEIYTLQGSGGVSYTWTDNGTFIDPIQTEDPQVQPLTTTMYYLSVEDANFCTSQDSVFITVPSQLLVNEIFDNSLCYGVCDGDIELVPSGGIAPYTVAWAGALDEFAENSLCPGTYDYSILDSLFCTTSGSIDITELPEYFIDNVIITPSTCFGESSGTIEVIDVDAVSYFNEETSETNLTGIFADLPASTYTLSITNALGCIADTVVAFGSVSGPIDLVPDFTDELVCYMDLVSFSAVAAGGSGNFSYNWYDCAATDNTCNLGVADPLDFLITQDTTLYVIAFDDYGCPSDTVAMSVHFNPDITLNAGPDDVVYICQEECVNLETGASGGNGNITVEWTDATDPLNPVFITDSYTTIQCPMDTALYIVTGNDGCNPPGVDSVLVIVWPKPEAIMATDITSGCYPTQVEFTNLTDTIYTEDCVWNLDDGSILPVCSDFTYIYAIEGEYWPSLTVTTEFGCTDTDSLDVPIEVHGYPEASFTWEPQPVTVLENEVQFLNLSTGEVLWNWDFGGLGDSDEENPVFEFPDIDLFVFPICLEVTNEFGCVDTLCRDLIMGSILLVYVPNAFTPDNNGVNDYFLPIVRGFQPGTYKLFIYDRWGNRLFYSEDPEEPWMGEVFDGEHYAQNDVYVWRIELKELSTAEEKVIKGHVTAVR